jgi:hypothetical protein
LMMTQLELGEIAVEVILKDEQDPENETIG